MAVEPTIDVFVLTLMQFICHLLLNRLYLLPQGEVVVEFRLDLALAGELSEQQVKEVDQAVQPVADLHDPIRAEVLSVLLSLLPE